MRKKRAANWTNLFSSWAFYLAAGIYVGVQSGSELIAFWKPFTGPAGANVASAADRLFMQFLPRFAIWFFVLAVIVSVMTKLIGRKFGEKWWQAWLIRIFVTIPYCLLTYHLLAG